MSAKVEEALNPPSLSTIGTSCEASVKLKDATLEATRRRLLSGILVLLAWCYYSFHTLTTPNSACYPPQTALKIHALRTVQPIFVAEFTSLLQLQQLE